MPALQSVLGLGAACSAFPGTAQLSVMTLMKAFVTKKLLRS